MVLKWRRINGRNVQVNVDEDKIKEKLKQDSINSESYKKQLLSNTDKKLTHQEMNNYRAHPDRIKERQQEKQRSSYGGLAGRTEYYMNQGVSEDDAFQEAMNDLGITNSNWNRLRNKPEHERRIQMPYKSDAQRKAVHANKNKSGLKILTSEHIKETQKTYFDNKIGEQSKELLSIPKFEGDIFFKDRLTRTNKRIRPEFKITVKSGKLNKYIIIDTKSNK